MLKQKRKKGFSLISILLFLFILALAGGAAAAYFLFFEQQSPQISINQPTAFLGKSAEIKISATDNDSGLRSLLVTAEQNGTSRDLYSRIYPRNNYIGQVGPQHEEQSIIFNPLKQGFKDGEVTITVQASDFSARNFLAGNSSTVSQKLTIDTKAPKILPIHTEEYIRGGGAGLTIYKVNDPASTSGITVNGKFFKGYPIGDGREDVFVCYFALPYNTTAINELYISATDQAGNMGKMVFATNFKARPKVRDRINISDRFLAKKIPEFELNSDYEMSGSPVEKYIFINNTMRRDNNSKIAQICQTSEPHKLWNGRFGRMAGASPAGFAEYRSYYYKNKVIDKQVHLGMDLASTKRAHIKAANSGKVIFADYLGIYGNMVMLDHGQGIFSLYSHMSQINVNIGESVSKGALLGLTGATGMAGGDHLHFSILVQGVFVDPLEWWDRQWIKVNIETPLLDSKF